MWSDENVKMPSVLLDRSAFLSPDFKMIFFTFSWDTCKKICILFQPVVFWTICGRKFHHMKRFPRLHTHTVTKCRCIHVDSSCLLNHISVINAKNACKMYVFPPTLLTIYYRHNVLYVVRFMCIFAVFYVRSVSMITYSIAKAQFGKHI